MANPIVQQWQSKAALSLQSAKLLYDNGFYGSSATRAYYAAYQAATAACIAHGDQGHFPAEWNNPSHDQLPDLIRNNGDIDVAARRKMSQQLRVLRRLREDADYRPGHTIDSVSALNALHGAMMILETLEVS